MPHPWTPARRRAAAAAALAVSSLAVAPAASAVETSPAPSPTTSSVPTGVAPVTVTPQAPTISDEAGTANDAYTIPVVTGVDYAVNGVPVPASALGKPQPVGADGRLEVVATPQVGYAFPAGATTTWALLFVTPALGDPVVSAALDTSWPTPKALVTWSAPGVATYDVSYHTVLMDGTAGAQIAWLTNTAATSAAFIPNPGDVYVVTVTAKDAAGNTSKPASTTTLPFDGPPPIDITAGSGAFSPGWQHVATRLPYYGGTAALGFRDATWSVTLPAGTERFELWATVHALGARGKLLVDGRPWADFETNSGYWGVVNDPYMYPVRTIRGWDGSKPVTVSVIAKDAGVRYLALDAYRTY